MAYFNCYIWPKSLCVLKIQAPTCGVNSLFEGSIVIMSIDSICKTKYC